MSNKTLMFDPLQFLRMARNDKEIRKEVVRDTQTDLIDLESKAKKKNLSVKEHTALKALFNFYVNYDNYRKKYLKAS